MAARKILLLLLVCCATTCVLSKPITNILNQIAGVVKSEVDHVAGKVIETAHAVRDIFHPGHHRQGGQQHSRQSQNPSHSHGWGHSHSHGSSGQGAFYPNYYPDQGPSRYPVGQGTRYYGHSSGQGQPNPGYPPEQGSYNPGYPPNYPPEQGTFNPGRSGVQNPLKPNYQTGQGSINPEYPRKDESSNFNYPIEGSSTGLATGQGSPTTKNQTTGPSQTQGGLSGLNPESGDSGVSPAKDNTKFDLTNYDIDIRSNVNSPVNNPV